MQKIQRDQNSPTSTFQEPGAKQVLGAKVGHACLLHITPPKSPSSLTPGHSSTLIPYKEQVCPTPTPRDSEQGKLPNKALFEVLVWRLVNFC